MKIAKTILAICAFTLLKVSPTYGQVDTAFWFAAPWVTPSHNGNTPDYLRIATYSLTTTVRVWQPAGTYDTVFTVPPNSLFSHTLSWVIGIMETQPANTILPYGIRIHSDNPITVVYEEDTQSFLNPETFSLKGQNGLGLEFVCPFQTSWNNGPFSPVKPYSQISMVATQAGTTVWITPKCNTVGHLANVSYSITLNEGQSYCVQNLTEFESLSGNNLSGTIITADKPIAVTVADDSVWEQSAGGCRDMMGDQIVPTDVIGTDYIVNKGQMFAASNEGIYIVGTQNFTSITVNDGTVTTYTMNQGDTWKYVIVNPLTYVTADKPIYVIQASGFGCELGEAILPPINCSGSNEVAFTRSNSQSFLLNILCKSGAQGGFLLNGSAALVPAASFTVVPGTGGVWMGAQILFSTAQIATGSGNLLTNTIDNFAMGVINGGTTSGCLYHYMSSFIRRVYANAGPDAIMCTNNLNINLSGAVTGGTTSGIWSTVNGTGTFTSATSLNTGYTMSSIDSTRSSLTFVLTSTGNCLPVTDTMVVYIEKSPIVRAGPAVIMCANNVSPVSLNGYFNYCLGATWSGGNGGAFGNNASASTTYTPSPADISAGFVEIKYTSTGSVFGCPNTVDSLKVTFTPAPAVVAGANFAICANTNTVSLNGTVTGGSSTGMWTSSGSGTFNPTDTTLVGTYQLSAADQAQTSIIIKLTSTHNGACKIVHDSLIVTITPAPLVEAGNNDTICSNMGNLALNGAVTGGASTGVWSIITGTGSFSSTSNLVTNYTFSSADTAAGQVVILLTSTGGSCPQVKDTIHVVIVKAPVVEAGNNFNVCANSAVVLGGVVSGFTSSGTWASTGTGTFIPNANTLNASYIPSANDISNGSVKFILSSTNNKGCNPTLDTVVISFMPAPVSNFTFTNNCFGTLSSFADSSHAVSGTIAGYGWNFGDGGISISGNVVHSYGLPGTYTVTHIAIGSNGCRDTSRKNITIFGLPSANFSAAGACSGNKTVFTDTSLVAFPAVIIKWHWFFGDGSVDSLDQNPSHVYPAAGTYTVVEVVESSVGCFDTLRKPVTVLQSPHAAFSMSENPANALDNIHFTDQSTPQPTLISWYWNFGDSVLSGNQNPNHAYQNQGDYQIVLVVTDQFGCRDTAKNNIQIALLPQIPTAFTPNGDGHNDILFVRGGPFVKLHFRVYDNWGTLVFESDSQTDGWDGNMSGVAQPLGVYVWVLDVDAFNNKTIHKSGDVTLLR